MATYKQYSDAETSLTNKIISEKVLIKDLDLENVHVFNAVLQALDTRSSLARSLDPKKENEKKVILAWLQSNTAKTGLQISPSITSQESISTLSRKIASLDAKKVFSEESHDNDIIKAYLSMVLKNKDDINYYKIFQSFEKDLVLKIFFSTLKGEEIVYRDKELDVPIYLLANADITLKISDPFKFVKYVDINLQQITMPLVISKLLPIISTALRFSMVKTITDNDICYYDLTRYYGDIAILLKNELQKVLSEAGISVTDSYIKNTSIPNGTDKIFENQRIEFMQREKSIDLQHKAELLSLQNYERKAEIHSKYPEYELGLTEKEKDNAVERYIIKTKGGKNEAFEKSKNISINERSNSLGNIKNVVEVYADKLDINGKSCALEIFGIIISIVLAISGIASMGSGIISFVLLAIGTALGGFSIASIVNKNNAKDEGISAQTPNANSSDDKESN